MNLAQLQSFVYAAQSGSITQGAKKAFISEPAMSKLIKGLEKELNVTLFTREGRGISLTDSGRLFLSYVELGLEQIQTGVEAVTKVQRNEKPVRFLIEVASAFIPEIINTIKKIYKETPVRFTQRITAGNSFRNFDFIISTRKSNLNQLSIPLLTEEIYVGSAKAFSASAKTITASELINQPIVTLAKNTPLRDTLDNYFVKKNIDLNYQYQSDDPASIRDMLKSGIGIGFIPAVTWHQVGSYLHLARIAPNPPFRTIYLSEGAEHEDIRTRKLANVLVELFVNEKKYGLKI
ncbi:LysR family transcriptional regulator [Lactobacillus sp. ESL0791]|uniref:LysR family transcriptional regulator n=1 Tax=Lactobacillus sp. ESL0791 TaxID=2983234 RepID=UPI0023F91D38|nr:LysR family transcriptional regulator [Lactobacillus sp. ESL0791]MDF7639056.1 LysR family transcriptional regulator [Lactobacillus sp. ESL0791]